MKDLMPLMVVVATLMNVLNAGDDIGDLVDQLIGKEVSAPALSVPGLTDDLLYSDGTRKAPSSVTVQIVPIYKKSMIEVLSLWYLKLDADLDKSSEGSISSLRMLGIGVDITVGRNGIFGSFITISNTPSAESVDTVRKKGLLETLIKNLRLNIVSIKQNAESEIVKLPTKELVTSDDVLDEFLNGSKIKELILAPV